MANNIQKYQSSLSPAIEDFGFTKETFKQEKENRELLRYGTGLSLHLAMLFFIGGVPLAFFYQLNKVLGLIVLLGAIAYIIFAHMEKKAKIEAIVINGAYDEYEAACQKWKITQTSYWTNVNGFEFEQRVAGLLDASGFSVVLTPKSNDGGIDIIATKGHRQLAVQCKCHKNPVGPKDARELYGVLMSNEKFTHGVLVCPSGFTKGVHSFVVGKPIFLIDIEDLQRGSLEYRFIDCY